VTRIIERLFYRIAKRWIAGYTLQDAIISARDANNRKMQALLNRLGEHTPDRNLIQQYVEEYMKLLDAIESEKLQATISIKPSQIGLTADATLYRDNLLKILAKAEEEGRFVWIDMENSPYTESTVAVYRELLGTHKDLGLCLQANMKRSESDLRDLLPRGGKIRLVKGAYPENGDVACKSRSELNANYLRLMRILFEQAKFFAIGTHDEKMINEAEKLSRDRSANFEFQLLKGIRDDLKSKLLTDGFKVSEYIPYGPEWYNYSKRRMRERKRNILLLIRSITG
jgi:proline dehydrogenase